jgi:polysaccharide export outer membrane protein
VALDDANPTLNNPEILPGDSIMVPRAGIVYVLGDVGRPGGFLLDHRSTMTVTEALAFAEGTLPSAGLSKARLIRQVQGNREEIPLDLKMILKAQWPDLKLQAGDIVYVPSTLLKGMGRRSIEVIESSAALAAVYATRP